MKSPAFDAAATPSAQKAGRPPRRQLFQRLCVLASAVLLLALSAIAALQSIQSGEQEVAPAPPRPPPAAAEILGGTVVDPKYKYRFMARLYTVYGNSASTCGGTLIGTQHVLTAAHCVAGNPTEVYVGLYLHGSAILADEANNDCDEWLLATTIEIHQNYGSVANGADIAVLTLERAPKSNCAEPITLDLGGSQDAKRRAPPARPRVTPSRSRDDRRGAPSWRCPPLAPRRPPQNA